MWRGVGLGLGLVLGCGPVGASTAPSGGKVPRGVAGAVELRALDVEGEEVDVAAVEGIRVVEFWATWCRPCLQFRPELEQLAFDFEGRGVTVIAVSVDQTLDVLKAYLENSPTSLDVLWDRNGRGSLRYTKVAMGQAIPAIILVDAGDNVVGYHRGYREDTIAKLRTQLEQMTSPTPEPM